MTVKGDERARRYARLYHAGYRLSYDAAPRRRKLQALRAIGHSNARIYAGTGLVNAQYIGAVATGRRSPRLLYKKAAEAIDAYYEDNWDKPDYSGPGKRAAGWAKARGWRAPLDWEDIEEGIEA